MKKKAVIVALILLGSFSMGNAQATETPGLENVGATENNAGAVAPSDTGDAGWWSSQPKEQKMLYTNVTAATAIAVWGLATWDYGSSGFHTGDEGWFERDSKYGGADKLGHFWATYAFSDALTGLYKSWGYAPGKASFYAALSSWTVQAFMEVGDATSKSQGFAWADMAMNTVGALTSVFMEKFPELDRKIDFRVEYVFNVPVNGIFDDYSNQYYSVVLKLDGFDAMEDTFLKYVELHGGYYTRGYGEEDETKSRSLYAGITVNLAKIFDQQGYSKTGKVLEYIQLPYTVPKVSHNLD
jgi:hypothetical protein